MQGPLQPGRDTTLSTISMLLAQLCVPEGQPQVRPPGGATAREALGATVGTSLGHLSHSAFLSSAFNLQVPKVAGSPLDLHPRPTVPPLRPRSLEWGGLWWHPCQGSGHRHAGDWTLLRILRLGTVLSEITRPSPTLVLLVLLHQHPINVEEWSLALGQGGMNSGWQGHRYSTDHILARSPPT